jgi:hypothetical protein
MQKEAILSQLPVKPAAVATPTVLAEPPLYLDQSQAAVPAPAVSKELTLPGLLAAVGIQPSAEKREGRGRDSRIVMTWPTGTASEASAGSFTDSMFAELDREERRCGGRFSSEFTAPIKKGQIMLAEATTSCAARGGEGGGVILYYQAGGKFVAFVQDVPGTTRDRALETRQKLESNLEMATNYQ